MSFKVVMSFNSYKLYSFSVLIVSVAYGFIVAYFAHIAHPQYLIYAESSSVILFRYVNDGLASVFFNEPIWLVINIFLGYSLEPVKVIETIAFFSGALFAYTLLIRSPRYFYLLILFLALPVVLRYRISGFRQGLAISLFIWAWFSENKLLKYFLYSLLPLIHSSFFFVLSILFLSHYSLRIKLAFDIRTLIIVSLGLIASFGVLYVASFFGARRGSEYIGDQASVSGFAFIYWSMVFVLFLTQGKRFLRNNAFQMAALTFYLSSYWFFVLAGRIFESVLILVLFSGLQLTGVRFHFFTVMILFYFLGTWFQNFF